jgi:hypothetical protein
MISYIASFLHLNHEYRPVELEPIDRELADIRSNSSQFKCKELIHHADFWFNLKGDPKFPLNPSIFVKWQLAHAAKSLLNEERIVQPHELFGVSHLSAHDLTLLYRIINSFHLARRNINCRPLLALIEDHITIACVNNPNFANEILDEFVRQEDQNLTSIIMHMRELINLSKELNVPDKKRAVLEHLQKFYDNIDHQYATNWEMEKRFYYFVKVVDRLFTEARVFDQFFDFKLGTEIANAPDFGGLQTLIRHFNTKEKDSEKYKGKLQDILLCNVSDLRTTLNTLHDQGFRGVKKIIVLNRGSIGGHYTPLFVKISDTGSKCIITDSGPFDSKFHWILKIQKVIQDSKLSQIPIYAFDPHRQTDGVSCSISSFRDVLESTKFDLVDYVEKAPKEASSQKNGITVLNQYPPCFMKIAQSLSYLPKYKHAVPESRTMVVASKSTPQQRRNDKTLQQVVDSHHAIKDGRDVNFYLRKRAFKYFKVILEQILK